MLQPLSMTYLDVQALAEAWCEEAGIDRFDRWHYPFEPDCCMSVTQVLWRFICEGRMTTLKGMKSYFDRYLWARKNEVKGGK